MKRVSIITESSLNKLNGNVARPRWEFESIKKNGFSNVQLVGDFSQNIENELKDDLIHAQQLTGKILKNSSQRELDKINNITVKKSSHKKKIITISNSFRGF